MTSFIVSLKITIRTNKMRSSQIWPKTFNIQSTMESSSCTIRVGYSRLLMLKESEERV